MVKTYNTPKRSHIVKTRLDDEEHADFLRRMELYGMSQSEFIREAISGATIKPTIVATLVSDDLLAAIGKLTAEYGRIGNNLNQIARHLNEWRSPYPAMAKELQDAAADLATLKFEVMKKVGDAVGNVQAYKNEKARQKYRDEHDSDFIILNAAKRYFDSKGLKKLPSYKALQTEVEQLIKEKNELYNQYQTAKDEAQRLATIRHNLEQTLGRKIEHKQEQER